MEYEEYDDMSIDEQLAEYKSLWKIENDMRNDALRKNMELIKQINSNVNWKVVALSRLDWINHLAGLILDDSHDAKQIAQNIIAICADPVKGFQPEEDTSAFEEAENYAELERGYARDRI